MPQDPRQIQDNLPDFSDPYSDLIREGAVRYGVDPDFALRIYKKEGSKGNHRIKSPAGAIGLMQLMPATAKRHGVDPYDPVQNIEGGLKELKRLQDLYGADRQDLIASGYNAGEGAVEKYNGVPPYAETKGYVRDVAEKLDEDGLPDFSSPIEMSSSPLPQIEQIPQSRPGVEINLSDFLEGKSLKPSSQEVSKRVHQSLGFSDDEALQYTKETGKGFYEGNPEDLLPIAKQDQATLGRVVIPELQPGAIQEKRDWLRNYRQTKAQQEAERKHQDALDRVKFDPFNLTPNKVKETIGDVFGGLEAGVGSAIKGATEPGLFGGVIANTPLLGDLARKYVAPIGQGIMEHGQRVSQELGAPEGLRKDAGVIAGQLIPTLIAKRPLAVGALTFLQTKGQGGSTEEALKQGLISAATVGAMGGAAGQIGKRIVGGEIQQAAKRLGARAAANIAIGEAPLAYENKLTDQKAQLHNILMGAGFAALPHPSSSGAAEGPVPKTIPTPKERLALPGFKPWEDYMASLRQGMVTRPEPFVQGRAGVADPNVAVRKAGDIIPPDIAAGEAPNSLVGRPVEVGPQIVEATGREPRQLPGIGETGGPYSGRRMVAKEGARPTIIPTPADVIPQKTETSILGVGQGQGTSEPQRRTITKEQTYELESPAAGAGAGHQTSSPDYVPPEEMNRMKAEVRNWWDDLIRASNPARKVQHGYNDFEDPQTGARFSYNSDGSANVFYDGKQFRVHQDGRVEFVDTASQSPVNKGPQPIREGLVKGLIGTDLPSTPPPSNEPSPPPSHPEFKLGMKVSNPDAFGGQEMEVYHTAGNRVHAYNPETGEVFEFTKNSKVGKGMREVGDKTPPSESLSVKENPDGSVTFKGWHGTFRPELPTDPTGFGGLHVGTKRAAQERLDYTRASERQGRPGGENFFPVEGKLTKPYGSPSNPTSEHDLYLLLNLPGKLDALKAQGYDGVIYRNINEDPGSISILKFKDNGPTVGDDAGPGYRLEGESAESYHAREKKMYPNAPERVTSVEDIQKGIEQDKREGEVLVPQGEGNKILAGDRVEMRGSTYRVLESKGGELYLEHEGLGVKVRVNESQAKRLPPKEKSASEEVRQTVQNYSEDLSRKSEQGEGRIKRGKVGRVQEITSTPPSTSTTPEAKGVLEGKPLAEVESPTPTPKKKGLKERVVEGLAGKKEPPVTKDRLRDEDTENLSLDELKEIQRNTHIYGRDRVADARAEHVLRNMKSEEGGFLRFGKETPRENFESKMKEKYGEGWKRKMTPDEAIEYRDAISNTEAPKDESGSISLDLLSGRFIYDRVKSFFSGRDNSGGQSSDPVVREEAGKIKFAPSFKEKFNDLRTKLSRGTTEAVEEFTPLKHLAQEAERILGRKLRPSENPYELASAVRATAPGKVFHMTFGNMIDASGNVTGKGLRDALAPVNKRRDDFTLYLKARRAIELNSRGLESGMTDARAKHVKDVLERENPDFESVAKDVYNWNKGVLEYVKQMAPEMAPDIDRILSVSKDYIPFSRVFDPIDPAMTSRGGKGSTSNPLKRMSGSERAIHDPLPQMINNAERLVAVAHKRRVYQTIQELAKNPGMEHLIQEVRSRDTHPPQLTSVADILNFYSLQKFHSGIDPVISVRQGDGSIKHFKVDGDLYKTLEGVDLFKLGKGMDLIFGGPARLFRMGTTGLRPSFSLVTNPARDLQTFLVQTQSQANPVEKMATYFRAVGESFAGTVLNRKGSNLDLFERLAVQVGQPLGIDIAAKRSIAGDVFKSERVRRVTNPLEAARELLSFTEAAPRLAELELVGKEIGWDGKSPLTFDQMITLTNAAKRVTVDFSAAGRSGKTWNQIAPFFNASIQGSRQMARNLKENPKQTMARVFATVMVPTLLAWWKNKDKEWYKEMPDKEKFLYWHVQDGERIIQIPKAPDYGAAFGSLPELLIDAAYRKDPNGVIAAFGHTFDALTPNPIPQTARPVVEQLWNKNIFFDKPIVPRGEQDKQLGQQRGPYTSKLAQMLGDIAPDKISPYRVDHLISSVGGGVARDVLDYSGLGRDSSQREKEASDTPIVGRLFRRGGLEGTTSKTLESFYDKFGLTQQRKLSETETEADWFHRQRMEQANRGIAFDRDASRGTFSYQGRQDISRNMREQARGAMEDESRQRRLGEIVDSWAKGENPLPKLDSMFKAGEISAKEFETLMDRYEEKILKGPELPIEKKFRALPIREMVKSFESLPLHEQIRVRPLVLEKVGDFYELPKKEQERLQPILDSILRGKKDK